MTSSTTTSITDKPISSLKQDKLKSKRYAEKLANHQTKEAEDSLVDQLNQVEKLKSKTLSKPIIVMTLSVITYILRWIWHGFIKAEQFAEHLIIDDSEVVSNSSSVS